MLRFQSGGSKNSSSPGPATKKLKLKPLHLSSLHKPEARNSVRDAPQAPTQVFQKHESPSQPENCEPEAPHLRPTSDSKATSLEEKSRGHKPWPAGVPGFLCGSAAHVALQHLPNASNKPWRRGRRFGRNIPCVHVGGLACKRGLVHLLATPAPELCFSRRVAPALKPTVCFCGI